MEKLEKYKGDICPKCKGVGRVWTKYSESGWVKCKECDGTGYVLTNEEDASDEK